jgi:dihydroorotate dehydrogenase electron transfer subunit
MMAAPTVARDAAATLVDVRHTGPYRVLTVHARDIVARARPGQFVSVGVDATGTLLRRPYAIAGVDPGRNTFDVAVAVVGQGSAWLASQQPSRALDVVGPLGRAFALPAAPVRCVLVGGGYGTAALEWLGQCLRDEGHEVELLSGAATASALYPVSRGVNLIETTEDGSRGVTGLVTAALAERLEHHTPAEIFACGPMPMLAAVADIARRRGCDCQVAVEEHMGCSVGVCMTCVVPTAEGEGERQRAGGRGSTGYVRACIEGPVLNAERVDWESVRRRTRRG